MAGEVQGNASAAGFGVTQVTPTAWTFAAGTTGAVAAHTLYTVTGQIWLDLIAAFCSSTLTSGGTPAMTVGTASAVATLIAAPTGGAPGIVTNDWWPSAVTPQKVASPVDVVTGGTVVSSRHMLVAENIVLDIPVSTITGGVLTFFAIWYPLSAGATCVATTPA